MITFSNLSIFHIDNKERAFWYVSLKGQQPLEPVMLSLPFSSCSVFAFIGYKEDEFIWFINQYIGTYFILWADLVTLHHILSVPTHNKPPYHMHIMTSTYDFETWKYTINFLITAVSKPYQVAVPFLSIIHAFMHDGLYSSWVINTEYFTN